MKEKNVIRLKEFRILKTIQKLGEKLKKYVYARKYQNKEKNALRPNDDVRLDSYDHMSMSLLKEDANYAKKVKQYFLVSSVTQDYALLLK